MLSTQRKELILKVIWFLVMAGVMYCRIYDYLSRYEALALFVIYTLVHVLVIERLVLGKIKMANNK